MAFNAQADYTILGWDVSGTNSSTSLGATTISSGLDTTGFNSLSRNGVTYSSAGNAFSSNSWNITDTFNASDDYLSFSLSPSTGNSLVLKQVSFASNGSNTGPATFRMGYSINGGAFVLSSTYTTTASITAKVWDFADVAISDTDTVEFRFWAYGATSINGGASAAAGTYRLGNLAGNDLVLTGVPEPMTYGVGVAGLLGLIAFARFRRARALSEQA